MDEPVTALILNAVRETDNGSADGCLSRQINIIRAAFAVYEYNTDRKLLQRIAVWCHYLEIEFEQLTKEDPVPLYQPADLMEFLVRFYQVTGLKAVLRICTRLRAAAFNWTSALHTFQQSIPVNTDELHPVMPLLAGAPADMDYDEKEKLINHAERLADGLLEHCADWGKEPCGILTHCTASYHDDGAGRHTNIVYGDYFLVEALMKLCGRDPELWS